uniref:Uncharacterized protein n=1 Tax=Pithovirus LCPAC406 TaxID=2506599 RepID=A0A481ZFX7_9VIRU|nr:MAG: uncharacterized protein LCPAC406_00330 [Pithovirus LCPAC406]
MYEIDKYKRRVRESKTSTMLIIFVIGNKSLRKNFMRNNSVIVLGDLTILDIDNTKYESDIAHNGIICFRTVGDNNVVTNTKQPVVYHYGGEDNPLERIIELISPIVLMG